MIFGMCRLFALHAGPRPVSAAFWLLDAPDSLREQSHREPDGAGIGAFDEQGTPFLDKQPIAAWQDAEFAREATVVRSRTVLAHVRYASTGEHIEVNTHPFTQDGRLFAHNGAFGELAQLDDRLADLGVSDLVVGQTDSERMFALITAEARANGGDVPAAVAAAVSWIADRLPVFALNLIIASETDVWALRYPETHGLYLLPPSTGSTHVSSKRIRAHTAREEDEATVVIASEPMDGESGWRALAPGELVHVDVDLAVSSTTPLPNPPRHQLTLADMSPQAAASQAPATQTTG